MKTPESSVPKPRTSRQCHNRKVNRQKGMWYWARAWTFEDGADLLIEVHDPIGEPHFHFLRANGDNIPISMLRPEYIEPICQKLTARERDAMLELFHQRKNFFALAWLWNNQNMDCPWVTKFPGMSDNVPIEITIPDYSLLEVKNEKEKRKMNSDLRSVHPYEPYIPEGATKLIVGTIPPYRFCGVGERKLFATDVNFYYGSKDNYFWDLMAEITGRKLQHINSQEAVEERKALLAALKVGITDIVASCVHKDGKSDDKSLCEIKCKPLDELLKQYSDIKTLIYTSRFVASQVNHFADKKYHDWSKESKLDGAVYIKEKKYNVKILYSPSPSALRSISADKRLERYKAVFQGE